MNKMVSDLKTKILKLSQVIQQIQEDCPHTDVKKVPKSDTGNWCPQDDSYWYECRCPECDKFWTEDQ